MTLPASVLDQIDIPRSHMKFFPTGNLQFCLPAQSNHILAAWCCVPILHRAGLSAMQLRSRNGHQFENLVWVAYREFGFDLFSVGLPVRSSVEPRHHDRLALLNPRVPSALCT